jgi:tRNA nucleotidyltransferase (CCA-adding enzyme)
MTNLQDIDPAQVRDLVLGRPRTDLDIVVEGDVGPIARELGGEAREYERFATAKATVGELEVDLARARAESYAHPGALPQVRPASLADDLRRRDFTINAMAVPLAGEAKLIDPHGGLDDLRGNRLRVLHPGSFRDDPTRALRAARYAGRLGLELDPDTAGLLPHADLSTVSEDRVEAELRKIAGEPTARRALGLASEWGLIGPTEGAGELIQSVDELLARPPWAGFAPRDDTILAVVLEREDETRAAARALAGARPARPSEGERLARGHDAVELLLARAMDGEWLDDYVSAWRLVQLEIDGRDLLAAGVEEGPAVGRGLEAALAAKLDGEVSGREEELRAALAASRGEA